MITLKCTRFASVIAILLLSYPQTSFAEGFTSADLLKWKETSQDSYIWASVTMAGVIASQNRKEAARCIDKWYSGNNEIRKKRNQFIRKTMRENSTYNPQAVIFAIVRKQCGRLFER